MNRRLFIHHQVHFEKWDYDTPLTRGIGGSETSQIELAWRFARRGWEVTSYAPVPWTGPREWRGTTWRPVEEADFTQEGLWLIYRVPEVLDNFSDPHPGQRLAVIAQDESFRGRWNAERVSKVDNVFALCESHRTSLAQDFDGLPDKVLITSNGIRPEQFRELAENMPEREPYRLMWASSPDRGLLNLARIFRRLRHWAPKAELHCFYGTDNIDKLIDMSPQFAAYKQIKADILAEINQPGIIWHGRVPQGQLIEEWAKSSVFCYPTNFRETSCISIMEAQAAGCIPVVSPVWALAENLVAGSAVCGDPIAPMTQCRFVGEIYRWMSQPDLAEQVRKPLMTDARFRFNWERQVDGLEAWILGIDTTGRLAHSQFNFQLKHAQGEILNVGCADDPADFKRLGATNLDLRTEDPIFHRKTKADIIADCRDLPLNGHKFDSVVYGDILEHFPVDEVPDILKKGKQCLKPGGRLILTIPDDHRPTSEQHSDSDGSHEYVNGVAACHTHRIPESVIRDWCVQADLAIEDMQVIDYAAFVGTGVVARPMDE